MSSIIKQTLKDKVNELSLLLMMSSAEDPAGVSLLVEMCDGLITVAGADQVVVPLISTWKSLKSKRATVNAEAFFSELSKFITNAATFVEDPTKCSFEAESQSGQSLKETNGKVDPVFLTEFIETHTSQIEELESMLLEFEFGDNDPSLQETAIKRYIHNIKGDAGSVGLIGIEKTCHLVEDTLVSNSAKNLVGQLMMFKEWLSDCVKRFAKGEEPQEGSADFIKRFQAACNWNGSSIASSPPLSPTLSKVESKSEEAASALPAEYMITGEKDILQEFAAEAEEHLGNVEGILLNQDGSYSKDDIDTIFRGIHSIKGGSAYFTLIEMTKTSHLLENMLSEVRDGKRKLGQRLTSLVFAYIDLQKRLLNIAKEAAKKDQPIITLGDSTQFIRAVEEYAIGTGDSNTESQLVSTKSTSSQSAPPATSMETKNETVESSGDKLNVKNFVKIETSRLDHMIDSIGEMMIYSSILVRQCRQNLQHNEEVIKITHRVEKFARDLQDVGMSMRLVPVKGLFQKMSRLVWDTSKKIKKEIEFTMEGEDTELDRNLIDKLADPLMHMVRNALDHGVESPEERLSAGKPRTGKVHLSASHSGGSIVIKIEDDGRGLNPDKLIAKAIEKGIIDSSHKLSEQEVFGLIFAAGFSTAAVVTDISGRGVGMDVVRRNVESLRGRIHIESEVGKGSVFTIELPLTLAIVDGIQVRVGKEVFIIPSISIVEFVKPKEDKLSRTLDLGETFLFRGKYLPVFRLAEVFNLESQYTEATESIYVVVENHREQIVIMVDEIMGELSTVIKSLGPVFEGSQGLSGCAVLPNGEVALILDVRSLVQVARTENFRAGYRHRINGSDSLPV